jgi:diguanylate cyclase (GGDEF)-like protein
VAMDAEAEQLLGGHGRLGHPLVDLAVESDRPAVRTLLERLEAGSLRTEVGLRCADGHVLHAALLVAAGSDQSAGATVYLHDISSHRSTVQVLAATQAVTGAMARAQSPGRAVQTLVASLGRSMGWQAGGYWTLAADEETLELLSGWSAAGADADTLLTRRFAVAGSLAERAFTAGTACWSDELSGEPMLAPGVWEHRGRCGAVAVPAMRAGAPGGALVFLSAGAREPDAGILDALSVAGAQVGDLLGMLQERLDAVGSLRRLALTDELTGLPNRRAWEEAVRRELARAVRDRHPVCVAVLDLDGFKRFNDDHGHQAGDRVLADSARAWQSQMRSSDVLARYGGEEFAALIPAWPLDVAVEVVERLRLATAGGLTASAGVASWDGLESGEELFGRADAALYEAKQSGRDRTVAAR